MAFSPSPTTIVNSSFTRLVVGSTGARLLTFNEHPHLEGEHLTYREFDCDHMVPLALPAETEQVIRELL